MSRNRLLRLPLACRRLAAFSEKGITMSEDRPDRACRKLSKRQERALMALASAPSYRSAAAAASVPERTLRHWLRNNPDFARAWRDLRQSQYDIAIATAQKLAQTAVAVLNANMTAKRASTRARAAIALLAFAGKGVDADLAERIAALEKLAGERKTRAKKEE
jgi:hypothetical protein